MNTNANMPNAACERVLGRLPEYADGGLLPLEEALDRGHLEACASCAEEAASWTDFHGLMGETFPADGALDSELFEGLEARLATVVIRRPAATATRSRIFTSLVGAAASLVALFGLEALGTAMDADGARDGSLFVPRIAEQERGEGEPSSIRDLVPQLFPESLINLSSSSSSTSGDL